MLIRSRRHGGRSDRCPLTSTAAALGVALLLTVTGCSEGSDDAAPEGSEASQSGSDGSGAGSGGSDGSGAGSGGSPESDSAEPLTAQLNDEAPPVAVVGEARPALTSVAVSRALFAAAPVVVLARADDPAGVRDGATQAAELGVPMLLLDVPPPPAPDPSTATSTPTDDDSSTSPPNDEASSTPAPNDEASSTAAPTVDAQAQRAEIARLGAQSVLAMGPETEAALGELPDAEVVTDPGELPEVSPAPAASGLTVLVRGSTAEPTRAAAAASAEAVGAPVIEVATEDLRADPAAIKALSGQTPARVLAVGAGFAPVERLSGRLEVAATGTQLPGGGQAMFPGRRLVALYGHPGTPGLGVLGEQGLQESIARAKQIAADYDPLSSVPVVPAFEIIATVAQASSGADGDYSFEESVEELRPWVEQAGKEGVYVLLDLQPGRANFLSQAKIYEDLLRMPHVGLALDPEWRLTDTQVPLGQIGQVEAQEVNSVIDWLADLTAQEKLPQKLLVLHQFRLSMLQDEDQIDLTRDQVQVLVHMDGQGSPDLKDGTWHSVVAAAPAGVPFGWKNFYDEDEPMLTPQETMAKEPTPVMISYQ